MSFSKSCTLSAGNLLAVAQLLNGPDSESNCNAQLQLVTQRQHQYQHQHQHQLHLQSQPQPSQRRQQLLATLQARPDPRLVSRPGLLLLLSFWHFLARRLSLVARRRSPACSAHLQLNWNLLLLLLLLLLLVMLLLLLRLLVNVCMHFPLALAPTHCANAFGTFTSQLNWR